MLFCLSLCNVYIFLFLPPIFFRARFRKGKYYNPVVQDPDNIREEKTRQFNSTERLPLAIFQRGANVFQLHRSVNLVIILRSLSLCGLDGHSLLRPSSLYEVADRTFLVAISKPWFKPYRGLSLSFPGATLFPPFFSSFFSFFFPTRPYTSIALIHCLFNTEDFPTTPDACF